MYYLVTINTGAGIERRTVIGDINAFVDRAYEDGALGVTILVRQ
ncbi:MAG: hypothetical protein ACM3WS_03580 [Bacillota bacterium]